MANFLSNLGAVIQGQQNYQDWDTKQEQAKLRIEAEKENLANIKELSAQAKKDRDRNTVGAKGYLDTLSAMGVSGLPQVPPDVQAPAPGQASVPMVQPQQTVQYEQRPIGPPPPQGPGAVPQMPPGFGAPIPQQQGMPPQGPPQGQQMPPQGLQGPQQGQPQLPPYRTVQGPSQPPQAQQSPLGIGPPPPQPPPMLPQNSTLQDAARYIRDVLKIDDPVTSVQILDRLAPRLDEQSRQQAGQLKLQLDEKKFQLELAEKAREADQRSKDYNLSVQQRADAAKEFAYYRQQMANIGQQNADTRSAQVKAESGGSGSKDQGQTDAMAWDYLIRGHNPPARGGAYGATMKRVAEIAKENGLSTQELVSASADVKTKLAAKKNFEVRAQNMERAENQIISEIPLIRDSIKDINLPSIPIFAKAGIAGLRQLGDPRITKLDQAVETVFNEFEGIRTGNPGALNVSDVQNAHKAYENAKTPQQMEAAIQGMERTIKNAKSAMNKTRKDIIGDINNSFKREGLGGESKSEPASTPKPINLPTSKSDLKTGQIYQTARGPAKWNGTAFEAQ